MNVDLNNTSCIAKQVNLLSTKYVNICNGIETEVPHGLATIILDGTLGVLVLVLTLCLLALIGCLIWGSL